MSKAVKKKSGLPSPGHAVIMSGSSKEPPNGSSSSVKDYVMGYTDIFEPSDEAPVVDIEEGDAISDCSDNEVSAHSTERAQYEAQSDSDEDDHMPGPPPLSSGESEGGEDLRDGPPPLDSDDADSSEDRDGEPHSFPGTRSRFGHEEEMSKEVKHRSGSQSDDSGGLREGPPPLDSEEEDEGATGVSARGVSAAGEVLESDEGGVLDEEREVVQEAAADSHNPSLSSDGEVDGDAEEAGDGLKIEGRGGALSEDEDDDEEEEVGEGEKEAEEEEEVDDGEREAEDEEKEEDEGGEQDKEGQQPTGDTEGGGDGEENSGESNSEGIEEEGEEDEEQEEEKEVEQSGGEDAEVAEHFTKEEKRDNETPKDELEDVGGKDESEEEKEERSENGAEEDYEHMCETEIIEDALEWDESFVPENIIPEETIEPVEVPAVKAETFAAKPRISKSKAQPEQVSKRFEIVRADVHPGKAVKKSEKRQAEKIVEEQYKKTLVSKSRTSRPPKNVAVESIDPKRLPAKTGRIDRAPTAADYKGKSPSKTPPKERTPERTEKKNKRLNAESSSNRDKVAKASGRTIEREPKEEKERRAVTAKQTTKMAGEGSARPKAKKASSSDSLSRNKEGIERTEAKQSRKKEEFERMEAKQSRNKEGIERTEAKQSRNKAHVASRSDTTERSKPKKPAATKSIGIGTDTEAVTRGAGHGERASFTEPPSGKASRNGASKHRAVKSRDGTAAHAHHHHHGESAHDRSQHVWLCRDDEIHKLIAQKASLLKEYESGSLAGRRLFSGNKKDRRRPELAGSVPDVGFAGGHPKKRPTRPMSELMHERAPYGPASRKKDQRRSLQYPGPYSGSSTDDDEKTDRAAALNRERGTGTFAVGLSARSVTVESEEDSDHEETCEYCAAEKAAREAQEKSVAWEGPHHPRNLLLGVVYSAKYLGSSQIMSSQSPNKTTRMEQAQEAVGRIKVPEGEEQPTTDIDLFISTERIKVVNSSSKEVMLDHALRTVSFIADIGDLLVLMVRQTPGDGQDVNASPKPSQILASLSATQTDRKLIKVTCHVFQCAEAQVIAKSIGQAFNVAYQEFLRMNGMSEETVEDAEYNGVLEAQKILGEDLSLLADETKAKDVVVNKKPGEGLGLMILESGWGSMIPTAVVAHLAKDGPATKSGRLNVGDQILEVDGTSLVGLTLTECQALIKNSRPNTKVIFKIVSCPPTVQVVVNRPDTKYQLGFSVQNGMICSLMRGSIAERGGVRVGHRIIEINNESIVATSHQHIVDLLATTVGEIKMKTMPAAMYRLLVGLDPPQYI